MMKVYWKLVFVLLLLIGGLSSSYPLQAQSSFEKKLDTLQRIFSSMDIYIYSQKEGGIPKQFLESEFVKNDLQMTISKEWADERIKKWAERCEGNEIFSLMFIFNSSQDHFIQNNHSFWVICLDKMQRFNFRLGSEYFVFSVASEEPQQILKQMFWREFMSGRLGQILQNDSIKYSGEYDLDKLKKAQTLLHELISMSKKGE